jgi:hypothetical protein
MDNQQAIVALFNQTDRIVAAYLSDLAESDLLVRPVPGANHIAWQLGHLISSERFLVDKAVPGSMPPLPDDFERRHAKEAAGVDDAGAFLSKADYARFAKEVRAGTLEAMRNLGAADFDKPVTGLPPVVKTVGEAFLFVGTHWLMHAGQWAIVRRKLGRPPLF